VNVKQETFNQDKEGSNNLRLDNELKIGLPLGKYFW
jgi:hypothetical protein